MKMAKRVALFLALLALESSSYGLVEPLLSLSPLGSVANFTCVPPEGVTFLRWDVELYGVGSTLRIPGDGFLTQRGIYAITANSSFSVLYVNATSANNGTIASCVLVTLQPSAWVTLIAYDRPDPPFDLRSRPAGSGRLLLSWTRPSVPAGVETWYVVVASQNGSLLSRAVVSGEQYEYSVSRPSASADGCQSYQFTVTAANGAGESQPSQLLTSSVPEVPYIQLAEALSMKLQGTDRSITFHLTMQVCKEFPVQSYCVTMIQDTQNLRFEMCIPANNGSNVNIEIHTSDGLRPDMKYIYSITAVNMVGNSTTSAQTLYTTDVQSSTITGSDHQLNVTCIFAEGTLAKGCGVFLEKSGEVVYQRIPRVNGTAKGVIRTEFSVDCYNISVVDWEEDGSIGSLITQVTIMVAPVNTTAVNMVATESSIQSIASTAPTTSVSSTYSTYLPLPSHLPTSSTADSSKVERMQWLVPIVCSIAAALFVATVTLLCLVFILWRMKGKRDKTTFASSEKDEGIYEAVKNQHPIYATLEPPRRIGVTNPTYMNKYESGYSSGTAATIEYAIPSAINEYEIPN